MEKTVEHISDKAGFPPGIPIHVGDQRVDDVKVSVISYSKDEFSESVCESPKDCFAFTNEANIKWIDIIGLHDTALVETIGTSFGLDSLLIEDVLNTNHRPKLHDSDSFIFFTMKRIFVEEHSNAITSEQISFVLKENSVVSFREQDSSVYNDFRRRLRDNVGKLRSRDVDYLLYRLIDIIVDDYFIATEYISLSAEELEISVIDMVDKGNLYEIQRLKRGINTIRKTIFPLREAISSLLNNEMNNLSDNSIKYYRDVYEHTIQISDTVDSQREILSNIMDLYLSGMSNKTNNVMQILTIISTIFIPLTFIVGVYGMNFEMMPELHWPYAYYIIWIIMFVIVIFLVLFFRKKKWL